MDEDKIHLLLICGIAFCVGGFTGGFFGGVFGVGVVLAVAKFW